MTMKMLDLQPNKIGNVRKKGVKFRIELAAVLHLTLLASPRSRKC
jgi:hypothetical protein